MNKLRKIAEKLLYKKNRTSRVAFSEPGNNKLIHELKIHQIELELQNEELAQAKEKAELSEKKYAELYDFAPSGYLTLTKTGEITDLNIYTEHLLGKERLQLINSNFGFFVAIETRAVYSSFLQKIYETNLKQTCEFTLLANNESVVYILANGIISNRDEKCLLTLTNISKQKQTENELIKAKLKAEESDRLKSAFLANMSHEIRTPMNGILGFTKLLKNPKLTGNEQQEYIDIIQKSGHRLLNIINDIISISRLESQQVEIYATDTNINEQVESIYRFFKVEAEQKGLHLSFKNGLKSDDAAIRTDREKLYGVLTNLVKNAIKFTKTGSIEFGYNVKGKYIEFYVTDTGQGISDEQKQFIFERFRQGNELLVCSEGSGLGLAISKAYVEMLGGEIWVESKIWHGSTFRFTLPNRSIVKKEIQLQPVIENKIKPNRELKVLVVDDEETSQQLFNIIIKPFAANYFQAFDGHEAVKVFRQNPGINLVLMDINMPVMNGYAATRLIRKLNKEVVIIAQTAYALPEDREKAIEAGCDNYISKPIDQAELIDLINQHLG